MVFEVSKFPPREVNFLPAKRSLILSLIVMTERTIYNELHDIPNVA
jgi:hypothetical protein